MKTVLPAKENIAKLWGHPKPKDTPYRLMKYLLQCEVEEGILLHNVVTGHLILLTKEEAESLSHLPANQTELTQELIVNHFLVPQDFDEYKSVNQLRRIFQSRDTGDAINHYIILPTTFCNAHCFYCYESDYPRLHMTEETANKLIEYIDEHRKGKDVLINWFGGEPLVGIQRIDQISQGLKERSIPFTASMVSNGYLFDKDIVQRGVKLWNLKNVQITLDGTEEVYNRVKAYVNVQDNPFKRVMNNINLLSENGVRVNIRINIDFYNKENIRLLIEELSKQYSENKNVSVYLNMLFNHQGFEPIHHSQEEMIELRQVIEDDTELLKKHKVFVNGRNIPALQFNQCMADNVHAVEIQPDGSLCRCEHENVMDSYGSIEQGVLDPEKPKAWKETIERSAHCPECHVYPFCFMLRRCMNADLFCDESLRQANQATSIKTLRSVYLKNLEEKKNESI